MTACHIQASATIELYFYGELTGSERIALERHLATCAECRRALEELAVIRAVLEARPDVSSPPDGDWSGFMARLEEAVRAEAAPSLLRSAPATAAFRGHHSIASALAMAALVVLVTLGVSVVLRDRGASPAKSPDAAPVAAVPEQTGAESMATDDALAQISEQHFERSKLVVLGLATRNPADATADDWSYERTLANSLLNDTRLYRQAAEERGMKTLAGVMRDLELVLLQTSMSEKPDAESLAQLQRLIRRRDLITKMEVVATTGLLP